MGAQDSATAQAEGRRSGLAALLRKHVELSSTILLAVAAVATAWASYQSARWNGVQAINFSKANANRVESTRASTLAGQQTEIDVLTFTQWVNAYAAKNTKLERFYFERFRAEFKPAVQAWIATRPLKNPDAPPSPFVMPQYKLAQTARAERLTAASVKAGVAARQANQRSDNYVLTVVLLAIALFFAGISTKLTAPRQRAALVALGYTLFFGAVAWTATFPVTLSV